MMERVPVESELTRRCRVCNFPIILKKQISANPTPWGVARGITPRGSYQSDTVPTPESFNVELCESDTISFSAASGDTPAKILDSAKRLADLCLKPGDTIIISHTEGSNNGTYALAERGGVTSGELSLASGYNLTTQAVAAAGTVTISVRRFKPSVSTGCPFCGSLNSY